MRLRLLALLPTVLLLAVLLPVPNSQAAQGAAVDTVVDEVDGLDGGGARRVDAVRVSAPTRTPIAFSMLAFTAPAGARIIYRTSVDGSDWTRWADAEQPEGVGPDMGSAEGLRAAPDHRRSGEPMWVGDAAWVQVKVTGARLGDIDVDLIDPLGLSRSLWQRMGDALRTSWRGSGPATAQAAGQPAIVTRARWGADESLRNAKPDYAGEARYAVLHHTVGTNSYTAAQAPAVVRGVYAYHTKSRGWSDIGYNFLVDRFGTLYEGRAGGIDRAVIGAHALGFNTNGIGVAMMGNHDTAAVSKATRSAIIKLLAWKFAVHGIDPSGKVKITSACSGSSCKHPKGKAVTLPTLFGHRDVGYTNCPGSKGYNALPGLRSAIAKRQVDVLVNHSVAPGKVTLSSNGLAKAVDFSVDVVPAAAWEFVIKYDDGTVMYSETGTGKRARVSWKGEAGIPTGTYWYKFTSGSRKPAIGTFTVQPAPYEPPFSDDDTSVHLEGIVDLYERGITKGCTASAFCPTSSVSRGQMASLLVRTMDHVGIAHDASTRDWFNDDAASAHQDAINALAANAIATGCGDDRFCPREAVVRGDVALWMAEAFGLEAGSTDHFADDDGAPYEWAVNALADAGLTEGCDDDRYCAGDVTSRGQMASFLSRAVATADAAGIFE